MGSKGFMSGLAGFAAHIQAQLPLTGLAAPRYEIDVPEEQATRNFLDMCGPRESSDEELLRSLRKPDIDDRRLGTIVSLTLRRLHRHYQVRKLSIVATDGLTEVQAEQEALRALAESEPHSHAFRPSHQGARTSARFLPEPASMSSNAARRA